MRVNFAEFSRAINDIDKFSTGKADKDRLLIQLENNNMDICYTTPDGKRDIIEKVEVFEAGDAAYKVIVNIKDVKNALAACSPSGSIKVDDLLINFDGTDQMKFTVQKYLLLINGDDVTKKNCSKVDKIIKYIDSDKLTGSILTRGNYQDIFSKFVEPQNDEAPTYDTWMISSKNDAREGVDDFTTVLSKISASDQNCFISSSMGSAYTLRKSGSITYIPVKNTFKHGFSIDNKLAKTISEIVNGSAREGNENVYTQLLDRVYCYIKTENEKVGIRFEIVAANRLIATALKRDTSSDYSKFSCVFNREAFTDIINVARNADKDDNAQFKFEKATDADGSQYLKCILKRGSAASSVSDLEVDALTFNEAEDSHFEDLKLSINLNSFLEVLPICTDTNLMFEFAQVEGGTIIKISDAHREIDPETKGMKIVSAVQHYVVVQ